MNAAIDIPAFYAARIPEPCTSQTRALLSADSKGTVMRLGALRAAAARAAACLGNTRTRLTAGEKPNRKRKATLVAVYDAEPAKRRPHDVIALPGGRHGARKLRPGPRARGKWLGRVSPARPRRGDRRRVRRGRGPRPAAPADLVVLVGGAEHQLDLIRAEAGRRAVTIYVVIDLIYVQYIWEAAWSLHETGDPPPRTGSRPGRSRCWPAPAAGPQRRSPHRPAPSACAAASETAGTPACADRLDIGGARWGLDGAEAVLTLRAVICNGDFNEYWRFHLAREHQRLYPGTTQGQYALTG